MIKEYTSALKNYAEFTGRSTRKEYWMFVLYNFLISIAVLFLSVGLLNSSLIYNLYTLALFIPSLAVGVRRMHDAGRNGWWIIVPVANLIFLCKASVDPEADEPGKLSGMGTFVVVALVLVPVIGILAAIAIPAYQTYTVKAKMGEVMQVGSEAQASVADYVAKTGHVPEDINQTEFSGSSRFINQIAIDQSTDAIVLTLGFSPLEGKKIILRPNVANETVTWSCDSAGIPPSYLPANCI